MQVLEKIRGLTFPMEKATISTADVTGFLSKMNHLKQQCGKCWDSVTPKM